MSSKSLLVLLSFGLLCLGLSAQTQRAFRNKSNCESRIAGLAQAIAQGDKSCVQSKDKAVIKSFGLMHLLTPSGLHLSSALTLFYFFPRLRIITCFLLLTGSFFVSGFFSLQRMLLFQIINFKLRNIKLSFFATMVASVLIGNYSQSPISFALSLLFWGTIVFHQGSKRNLILSLFIAQSLVAMAFSQELNPLALIVNPLITAIFTVVFPLFLALYPFGEISHFILGPFAALLEVLQPILVINTSGILTLLLGLMLSMPSKKWAFILIIFCFSSRPNKVNRFYQSSVATVPEEFEFLKNKKNKAFFLDRTCRFDEHGRIKCKKKPSKYGGPYL